MKELSLSVVKIVDVAKIAQVLLPLESGKDNMKMNIESSVKLRKYITH